MLLDTSTLYLVAAMVAAMLGAMLLFFGRQENIPALIWWGAALSARRRLGRALDARQFQARRHALAGAQCVGFVACGMVWSAARVFHGRKPSLPGLPLGRLLGSCRDDAGAAGIGDTPDDRRRHRRGLCRADGRRTVVGAPQDPAETLAGGRGAGAARFPC